MAPNHIDPDVELMLRFKNGDEDGFRTLFANYQTRIINFCFRFCANYDLAEDLAQEVFLRVYRAARRYRPTARFSTWVYRIAVNVCLNENRKLKKNHLTRSIDSPALTDEHDSRMPEYPDENQVAADDMIVAGQRDEQIRRALRKLPEQQRAAVVLRIYDGFSYREIADQMRVREGKVKTLIFRGRQQMKQALEEWL
jgi:RNA polymerase sigma-70 factor (ECF subfamily)